MEMMQYRPWEKNEVNEIISKVGEGQLPILDIQLGGQCPYACEYCDDVNRRNLPCLINMDSIYRLMCQGNTKGVYVCGIGEPTACSNYKKLIQLLDMCYERNIWVSMYTNGLRLSEKILKHVDNGTLNLLYKYDTERINVAAKLYGISRSAAMQQFTSVMKLKNVIHNNNGVTNIGASIVPSSENIKKMRFLINCCLKSGIFPMIGELENAGNCHKHYEELKISGEELQKVKDWMLQEHGIDYQIPVCPATISGIHIDNFGQVIIDGKTGLSCSWFWMEDPEMIRLGSIDEMSYEEIVKKILEYRDSKYQEVLQMIDDVGEHPFGGCGGDVKHLLKTYTEVYQPRR